LIKIIEQDTKTVFLYPAALVAGDTPTVIHTILGSCVAVCLFDQVKKSGGMNHYMLPQWNGVGLATPKYGNIAIERLLESMVSMGSKKEHLVAKVFGGGAVIETSYSQFNIGERNISTAFDILKEYRIPIISQSTGGKLGRKIIFNTSTGEVVQRYVQPENAKLNGTIDR
jgi:chemotaxis protein CheD